LSIYVNCGKIRLIIPMGVENQGEASPLRPETRGPLRKQDPLRKQEPLGQGLDPSQRSVPGGDDDSGLQKRVGPNQENSSVLLHQLRPLLKPGWEEFLEELFALDQARISQSGCTGVTDYLIKRVVDIALYQPPEAGVERGELETYKYSSWVELTAATPGIISTHLITKWRQKGIYRTDDC
jgi:hypothetical protein